MGLRDTNPYIDTDLALIISTFEKSMIQSNNENSVLVPFRRDIDGFTGVPRSAIDAINTLPAFQENLNTDGSDIAGIPTKSGTLKDDDEREAEQLNPSEDADVTDEWKEKAKEWIADCVPCDFRSLSKFDPKFFKNIKAEWDGALGKIDASLDNFENNLLNSETVYSSVCDIAAQLKPHCVPDLKKIIWLLNFMLSKLNKEFDINLNIFDSLLTGILSPVFNAMIGNLDLIDDLALSPIRCVLDQINLTIKELSVANSQVKINIPPVLNKLQSRLDEEQGRARAAREQASERETSKGSQNISGVINNVKNELDFDILKNYIEAGFKYVKNYKDWLIGLLKEMVGEQTDSWNEKIGLSGKKLDLLRLIGLIKSIIEASKDGNFACGTDSGLTKDDLRTLIDSYVNPNAALDVSLEDDNLVIRRNRRQEELNQSDVEARNANLLGNEQSGGGTGSGDQSGRKIPSNIVYTKPISSCLKNVTAEEFSQVETWIRDLEDRLDND